MSDEILEIGKHVGSGVGGAGLVGFAMRYLWGREQTETATRLALIEEKLTRLLETQEKHNGFGERLALVEQAVKAAHERLDRTQLPPRAKR